MPYRRALASGLVGTLLVGRFGVHLAPRAC
jgi:hypothetical protein